MNKSNTTLLTGYHTAQLDDGRWGSQPFWRLVRTRTQSKTMSVRAKSLPTRSKPASIRCTFAAAPNSRRSAGLTRRGRVAVAGAFPRRQSRGRACSASVADAPTTSDSLVAPTPGPPGVAPAPPPPVGSSRFSDTTSPATTTSSTSSPASAACLELTDVARRVVANLVVDEGRRRSRTCYHGRDDDFDDASPIRIGDKDYSINEAVQLWRKAKVKLGEDQRINGDDVEKNATREKEEREWARRHHRRGGRERPSRQFGARLRQEQSLPLLAPSKQQQSRRTGGRPTIHITRQHDRTGPSSIYKRRRWQQVITTNVTTNLASRIRRVRHHRDRAEDEAGERRRQDCKPRV